MNNLQRFFQFKTPTGINQVYGTWKRCYIFSDFSHTTISTSPRTPSADFWYLGLKNLPSWSWNLQPFPSQHSVVLVRYQCHRCAALGPLVDLELVFFPGASTDQFAKAIVGIGGASISFEVQDSTSLVNDLVDSPIPVVLNSSVTKLRFDASAFVELLILPSVQLHDYLPQPFRVECVQISRTFQSFDGAHLLENLHIMLVQMLLEFLPARRRYGLSAIGAFGDFRYSRDRITAPCRPPGPSFGVRRCSSSLCDAQFAFTVFPTRLVQPRSDLGLADERLVRVGACALAVPFQEQWRVERTFQLVSGSDGYLYMEIEYVTST
ncbi:hypothetical protein BDZ89DRAFT_1222260 [Hymenopellis radicata]|nr:hypothetical protein BDZ89DRAFT_1222260 [Hymenopellis radicata]